MLKPLLLQAAADVFPGVSAQAGADAGQAGAQQAAEAQLPPVQVQICRFTAVLNEQPVSCFGPLLAKAPQHGHLPDVCILMPLNRSAANASLASISPHLSTSINKTSPAFHKAGGCM